MAIPMTAPTPMPAAHPTDYLALRSQVRLIFLKIKTKMDILSHARIPLCEDQISGYAAFMANCRRSAKDFGLLLETVEGGGNLNIAQKEILIDNLSLIICEGEALLKRL